MDPKSHRVIFTGQLVEGQGKKETLARLASLFGREPEAIRRAFRGAGTVVVDSVDEDQAHRLVASLRQAGAICEVRIRPAAEPPNRPVARQDREKADGSASGTDSMERPPEGSSAQSTDTTGGQEAPSPALTDIEPALAELDHWSRPKATAYALMLLVGFTWPLLRHSIVFGSEVLLWPWQQMGFDLAPQSAAAIATASAGSQKLLWVLAPLLAGVAALLLNRRPIGRGRFAGMTFAGGGALTLLLAALAEEGEVLGLVLVPPTMGGGLIALAAVLAASLVVSSNRVRKFHCEGCLPRILSGVGGIVLLAAALLAFLGDAWQGWSIQVLYLLMAALGAFGLKAGLTAEPSQGGLALTGKTGKALCYWFPLAGLFTQSAQGNSYVDFVVSGGGGFVNHLFSVAKLCLVYGGAALLMTLGLAGLLQLLQLQREIDRGRDQDG